MQYAIARVLDENTKLPKLVFISWVNSYTESHRR